MKIMDTKRFFSMIMAFVMVFTLLIGSARVQQASADGNTIEAESYNGMSGIANNSTFVGSLDNNDWAQYNNVPFAAGTTGFSANIAVDAAYAGQKIELRLDSTTGTLIGTLTVQSTGGWNTFTTQSTTVTGASGTHNLYLVFKGANGLVEGVGNLDWFKFTGSATPTPTPPPTPTPTPAPTPAAFSQTTPASGATNVNVKPSFTWGTSTGAVSYALIVSTNSSYTSPSINVSNLATASYTPSTALAANTLYYWKVTATNANSSKIASNAGISFTTGAAPTPTPTATPTPTPTPTPTATPTPPPVGTTKYEAENASLSGGTIATSGYPGNSGTGYVEGYQFNANARTDFTVNVASAGNRNLTLRYAAGNSTVTSLNLIINGTVIKALNLPATGNWYTWADKLENVSLNNGVNTISFKSNSSSSDVANLDYILLQADPTPSPTPVPTPGTFSQSAPVNGATNANVKPSFTWGASTAAASYTLVVSTNSSYTSPAINVSSLTGTSYTPTTALAANTLYYWKVTATNATGSRLAGNAGISFTTGAAPTPTPTPSPTPTPPPGSTYYVSPSGNDSSGTGASGNPWKTLAYAAAHVPAGVGSTIYLTAGTFVETKPALIPLGVNIQGAGEANTILSSSGVTLAPGINPSAADYKLWYDGSLIQLISPHYTVFRDPTSAVIAPANGNQTITGFTIDGNSKSLKAGVWVENRNNVTLHHVTFKNLDQRGAVFGPGDKDWFVYPAYYMTGTKIYNCTFINSGKNLGDESIGNLNIAQLDGADIYNITINDNQGGYGIKFIYDGYLKNVKIHDSTITVSESDPMWGENISIELWNLGTGNEIYNVNCNTWLSLVNHPGIFDAPVGTENMKVHGVRMIDLDGDSAKEAIEIAAPGIEVYDSYFQNKGFGMALWDMGHKNISIHNNIFYNTTEHSNWAGAGAIYIDNSRTWSFTNINIYNNVFDTYMNAVKVTGSNISGVNVINNAFLNVGVSDLEAVGSNIVFKNNLKYNAVSKPWVINGATTQANNILGNPGYLNTGSRWDTFYKPSTASSFAVDKGLNVGLPYNGSAPDIGRWEN
ncbi:carbohydrate-binding protein [Paenibacillus psychroresistens]|nr:carbohydrate-binding protein [Paenibacillus psychroresistens]